MASMWADLLGLSAMASKMGSAPFNRGKVILQAQDELVRLGRISVGGRPSYGLFDALARTVTVEGPLALWRGVLYDVALYLPTQALNFLLKDAFRKLSPFTRQQHGYPLWFLGTLMSGSAAGVASLLFTTPLHVVHTVIMADVLAPELGHTTYQYSGALDVLRKTVQHSGPLGVYNGFGVTVAGAVLYRGLYFGLYDSAKAFIAPRVPAMNSFLGSFLMGWSVTILAGLLTYPLDTIRRRMMIAGATPMAYSNTLECTLTIWREEGLAGFFRGALANIARALVGALLLSCYDAFVAPALAPAPPPSNANANAN
jgi:solute carrier family 25 (adenine nucleotide translocator) protein 4/5/6/31